MKRLILILLVLPLFVFSQNTTEYNDNYAQITLKDASIIDCLIQSENNETITYYNLLDKALKTISKDLIIDIKGKNDLSEKEKEKISREIKNADNESMYLQKVGPTHTKMAIQSKDPFNSNFAGDYLVQAGNSYLWGVGLGIAGGGIISISDGSEEMLYLGAGVALAGFVSTIVGHTKLIKAGKAMKVNRGLSLQPSTSGIGLALKF